MNAMKFALGVCAVAVAHFFLVLLVSFVAGTTGGLKFLALILGFPLSVIGGPDNLPPLIGWGAVVLLSLAWGFAMCAAVRHFLKRTWTYARR